jgi:hypothetical protein
LRTRFHLCRKDAQEPRRHDAIQHGHVFDTIGAHAVFPYESDSAGQFDALTVDPGPNQTRFEWSDVPNDVSEVGWAKQDTPTTRKTDIHKDKSFARVHDGAVKD